uniref:Death domain-containing protein n=1 Tax=Amphimedon queenslandica TaxID=400682 RepID=A0A1X7T5T9_AMPQE
MLLLLSGDVECNPGPTIDDRPDISLLIQWLEPLVPWKQFGSCLVEMKEHDILKIEQENIHLQTEHKKFALYSKWLSVNPKATWRDVIDALENIKENTLVQDIKNYMDSDAASTVSSLSPRISNSDGETALILACKGGHEDIVYNLLSAGANVDIKDNKRWTALMIASEHNHISIIHMLLQANANPHLKTPKGFNAIMIAGFHGNYEAVRLLIREGVDYEYQQEDGWNALMMACQNGFTKIVELLLKVKVDPNVQEKDGWNALMIACKNGRTQIVELLLKKKIDPDVQNKDGLNALMVACQN